MPMFETQHGSLGYMYSTVLVAKPLSFVSRILVPFVCEQRAKSFYAFDKQLISVCF